jgi:hypothetical protein
VKSLLVYENELSTISDDELDTLFNETMRNNQAEAQAKRELKEKARFFNRENAKADLDHWSKTAYWTLDEAVALTFGKETRVVNWAALKSYVRISAFAGRYSALRDLALRANATKQLYDPDLPGNFLGWAKRNDIAYPPELETKVIERGNHVGDWPSSHDDLKKVADERAEALQRIIDAKDKSIRSLSEERDGLLTHLAEAEKSTHPEALGGKERESLLKLIAAMAIKGYCYNPTARRNDATADIAHDLALLGISLDRDTILKWLRESADLLPPEALDDLDP